MPAKRRVAAQPGKSFLFLLLLLVLVLATMAIASDVWIAISDRGF